MYEQKTMTLKEFKAEQKKQTEDIKKAPLEERLKKTVEKMLRITRAGTGAGVLYADMLLSMLPNSTHKVNMAYWCYKADRDDFDTILELMELMKEGSQIIWLYEKLASPYAEELKNFAEEYQ
ncbi:MAG: hypothetical protein PHO62_08010 [Sulfurimonas sp.]|uniref:hypothetical protein n=1 Tax=Sulfurimonas sp. TaxID=2022749 RepID=UPI002628FAE9|nr:hypothetical protein [Sulfurimonas sp.]MDD5373352.1 hypothetical protein [Sulfurimonas sp.]